jgi:hypothetical protein
MLGHCWVVFVGFSDVGCNFLLREVHIIVIENVLEFLGNFLCDLFLLFVMMEND